MRSHCAHGAPLRYRSHRARAHKGAYLALGQRQRRRDDLFALTWTDAAVAFFGYDPLAKVLYQRLGGQFDEHIS